jgi:hypothetical protein
LRTDNFGMTQSTDTISIRLATPDDAVALRRLAALDSSELPSGPMLLAEREGQLQAAISLDDGHRTIALADPFVQSAELLELLRLRASRQHGRHRPHFSLRRPRLRRAFAA